MEGAGSAGRARLGWREALLVLLGYLAVTWLYWAPFFEAPAADYSVGRDYFQNVWNLWWVRFAWEHGQPFYQCDWLFFPAGTSLAFHTISFANSMPGLILQDWMGTVPAHSLLFLSAFPFSALAAWGLARWVTGSPWGAFLAGLFYAFNPYHTAMVTQLNNAQFQWIPLFFLALLLLYREGRWWHVAWSGLMLGLAGYADWYQPLFCALGGGLVLLLLVARDRRWTDVRLWARVAAMGVLGALIMLPGALPLVRVMGAAGGELEVPIRFVGEMGLLGVHPQGSPWFHFWPAVLGWSTCLLLAYGIWRVRDRAARVWWWLLGFAFVFLQGPYLVIGNRHIEAVPLPMALFPHLPVLSVIRVPHRFLILLVLALGVLLAFALREAMRAESGNGRRSQPARAPVLAAVFCALVAFELQPAPRRPAGLEPPEIYAEMAADKRDYAVLELPIDFRDAYSMYLQTRHEKRLVAGYTSHVLPAAVAELRTPLMRALQPEDTDYDVAHLPRFEPVDVGALGPATLDAWRRELLEEKQVRVIVFRSGPDFLEPEHAPKADPGFWPKLVIALVPFRASAPLRNVERWRRAAAARNARSLAERSGQARRIVEALFGPPGRVQGSAEIWDLRAR